MPAPGKPPSASLEWTAATDIGRRRQNNEDSWGVFRLGGGRAGPCLDSPVDVTDDGLLLVISDGMGGARAGEEASRFCVQQLPRALTGWGMPAVGSKDRMRRAIIATHDALVELGNVNEQWRGMGATLSALWFQPAGGIVLGHVGDSRIYGFRGDQLLQLSEDQNVGAGMVRRGELTEEAASRLKFRSLLEQAMGGDGSPIEPQVAELSVGSATGLALCSDGFYGPLRDQAVGALRMALTQPALATATAGLIATANEAGGPDNITVILARIISLPSP
jgi:protein phosphatase